MRVSSGSLPNVLCKSSLEGLNRHKWASQRHFTNCLRVSRQNSLCFELHLMGLTLRIHCYKKIGIRRIVSHGTYNCYASVMFTPYPLQRGVTGICKASRTQILVPFLHQDNMLSVLISYTHQCKRHVRPRRVPHAQHEAGYHKLLHVCCGYEWGLYIKQHITMTLKVFPKACVFRSMLVY